MRRLPIVATLIVALVCVTMVWLGVWQLERARWKDALLARYAAAQGLPTLEGLPESVQRDPEAVAFRRASLTCDEGTSTYSRVQIGGRSRTGSSGYRNIAVCETPRGEKLMLDIGVSPPGAGESPAFLTVLDCFGPCPTEDYVGILIPNPQLARRVAAKAGSVLPLLLVADRSARPLQPSAPPAIADIPNNHRAYAVQWFLFAGVAATIYLLALRRRRR